MYRKLPRFLLSVLAAAGATMATGMAEAQPMSDKAWMPSEDPPHHEKRVEIPPPPNCLASGGADVRCHRHTERHTEHAWYGWQLIVGDSLTTGVAISGAANSSAAMVLGSVGAYLLVPQLVHIAQGQGMGRVGASLALRAGLPALGSLLPLLLVATSKAPARHRMRWDESSILTVSAIGIGAGVVGAMVLDTFLARREQEIVEESWRPTLSVDGRGVTVGVVGRL